MSNNEVGFRNWLSKTKKFQRKVVCDILSRKNRLFKIKKYEVGQNLKSYLIKLEDIETFKNLTLSVKSQLRRSVRLFAEFHSR